MEESLFSDFVRSYFPGLVRNVTTALAAQNYLHKTMLRPVNSPTLRWDALTGSNAIVAADVVAFDSSLPLKKRDVLRSAGGEIPKMGMEMKLNERQLTDLRIMQAQGADAAQIAGVLFNDTPKVIGGILERCEHIFLEGLSTGVALLDDNENVGTGVRIDYGFNAANKFGVTALWSGGTAKPFSDIQRVLDKAGADGNSITTVLLDRAAFNNIAKTDEAKTYFAASINAAAGSIATPTLAQLNNVTTDRFGFQFQIVDKTVNLERNGVRTAIKPWAAGQVVFLTSPQVGTLTYGRLAEADFPVAGVAYQTADSYILVSKYRKNEPSLSEHTKSQALVLPVIDNVNQIYTLDSTLVQA